MQYTYDDGGRKASGYKGSAGDCTVRAIAIATGRSYQAIYLELFFLNRKQHGKVRGKSPRDGGSRMATIKKYLAGMGWEFVPTMSIGSGCKVHLRDGELPNGTIIARVSKHLVAIVDGVIHNTYDPSRDGTRCVYGYFQKST
ncbi:MAG: hypothetical protein PHI63_06615 [Patescibacteria group bacterium]|nr:hypothetical protein [Patescibacteria group bacterium]